MSAFVQLVEFTSSRTDDIMKFNEEWRAANPDRLLDWSVIGHDRDKPGAFVVMVHFASYEVAMENSNDPRTSEYAAKMAELCDGPPTFRNLDVVAGEGLD